MWNLSNKMEDKKIMEKEYSDGKVIRKQRNKALDCYKGVLMVLVVLGHVFQYSVSDWNYNIFYNLIWAVQMPGFMLVSGYFSFKEVENGKNLMIDYGKSVERYFLPFLMWFILSVLLLGDYERSLLRGLISIVWGVDKGLWFIWVIFILSLILGLCNLVRSKVSGFKKQVLSVAVVFGGCYGVLFVLARLFSVNFLGIKFILYYGLFYGLGWLIRWGQGFWENYKGYFYDTAAFICICIFTVIVFNVNLYLIDDDLHGIALRFIAGATGNYVLYYVIRKMVPQLQKIKMEYIGMYTLEIYVTHFHGLHLFSGVANGDMFFSIPGFIAFTIVLIGTVIFTGIVILVLKSIPGTNYLLYGKK